MTAEAASSALAMKGKQMLQSALGAALLVVLSACGGEGDKSDSLQNPDSAPLVMVGILEESPETDLAATIEGSDGSAVYITTVKNSAGQSEKLKSAYLRGPGSRVEDGYVVLVEFGDDQMPTRALLAGIVVEFHNFTDSSVDMVFLSADGQSETVTDVPLPSEALAEMKALAAEPSWVGYRALVAERSLSGYPAKNSYEQAQMALRFLKLVGPVKDYLICGAGAVGGALAIYGTVGFAAPIAIAAAGLACSSLAAQVTAHIARTEWNNEAVASLLDGGSVALGCVSIDPGAMVECLLWEVVKSAGFETTQYFLDELQASQAITQARQATLQVVGSNPASSQNSPPPVPPATFTLVVSKSGSGSGTVNGPSGVSCGFNCLATYANGENVILAATPASGSTFMNWSGCSSTNGTQCAVSMTGNKLVTAAFTATVALDTPTVSIDMPSGEFTLVRKSTTFSFSGSATAPGSSVQAVEWRVGTGSWSTALGTTSWSFTITETQFGFGFNVVQVRSRNVEGLTSAAIPRLIQWWP